MAGRKVPEQAPKPLRLEFRIPGPDEPGFIRRQREAMRLLDALNGHKKDAEGRPLPATGEDMDAMLDFLLRFAFVEGDDAEQSQARDLIFDFSRNRYDAVLKAILRESQGPLS